MTTNVIQFTPWNSIADDNLTTKELAVWIKRSVDTLKRWRRLRIGPPHFTINGRTYYSKRQVQAWIESQREQCQGDAA